METTAGRTKNTNLRPAAIEGKLSILRMSIQSPGAGFRCRDASSWIMQAARGEFDWPQFQTRRRPGDRRVGLPGKDARTSDPRDVVVEPNQMRCSGPNQVGNDLIITVEHPSIGSDGGRNAVDKFIGLGLRQSLPPGFPVQRIKFDVRESEFGSEVTKPAAASNRSLSSWPHRLPHQAVYADKIAGAIDDPPRAPDSVDRDYPAMEGLERAPMPDADHGRCRQGIGDRAIERRLFLLISR